MRRTFPIVTGLALLASSAGCGGLAGLQQLERALQPTPRTTVSARFNPREHERIAILVEDNSGQRRGSGLARQAEDEFMQAAMAKGYVVADRSNVSDVIQELRFQSSGATAQDYEQVGHMLNVSAILVVSIDNLATRREETHTIETLLNKDGPEQAYFSYATIGGRLISVREAEVLWVGSLTGKQIVPSSDSQAAAVPYVSRLVATAMPARL